MLPRPKKWRKGRDLIGIERGIKVVRRPPRLFKPSQADQGRMVDRALADFIELLPAASGGRRKLLKTLELTLVTEEGDGLGKLHGPEAYQIDVAADTVRLAGTDGPALRAALVTLGQMLVCRDGRAMLPAGQLTDWPDLLLRGFHVDLACQSLSFDYVCDLLTRMAGFKYNAMLLEWGDKFPYQGHRILSHPDAFDPRQVSQLLELAESLGIVVIPLVQTLGHAEFILRHPQFAHLSEVPGEVYQLATGNPESLVLAKQLVDQLIESHPNSPYIHLGADETNQLGQHVSAEQVADRGKSLVWIDYMNVICRHVQARGRMPIVWDDMLLAYPEALSRFTRDCLLMDWHYEVTGPLSRNSRLGAADGSNYRRMDAELRRRYQPYWSRRGGRPPRSFYSLATAAYLQDAGFRVILAPAVRSFGDSYAAPRLKHHLDNCRAMARGAAENGSLGLMATSWSVRRSPVETTVPGLIAAADAAWNASAHDSSKSLVARLEQALVSAARPGLLAALDAVGRAGGTLLNSVGFGGGWDRRRERWGPAPLLARIRRDDLANVKPSSDQVRLARKVLRDARSALARLGRLNAAPDMHPSFLGAWRYAARETALKAAQWLFFWQVARLVRVDRGSAATLARQGAALMDEIRRCQRELKRGVGPSLTPGGLEEEMDVRFAAEMRLVRRAVRALRSRISRIELRSQLANLFGLPNDIAAAAAAK